MPKAAALSCPAQGPSAGEAQCGCPQTPSHCPGLQPGSGPKPGRQGRGQVAGPLCGGSPPQAQPRYPIPLCGLGAPGGDRPSQIRPIQASRDWGGSLRLFRSPGASPNGLQAAPPRAGQSREGTQCRHLWLLERQGALKPRIQCPIWRGRGWHVLRWKALQPGERVEGLRAQSARGIGGSWCQRRHPHLASPPHRHVQVGHRGSGAAAAHRRAGWRGAL